MITRVWHGWTTPANAPVYENLLRTEIFTGIHAGDSTRLTSATEDGSSCVNSGVLANGQGYSVTFPTPGNYKLVCLVHNNMTGVVHVLDPALPLPHNQSFYDNQSRRGSARHPQFPG